MCSCKTVIISVSKNNINLHSQFVLLLLNFVDLFFPSFCFIDIADLEFERMTHKFKFVNLQCENVLIEIVLYKSIELDLKIKFADLKVFFMKNSLFHLLKDFRWAKKK